jgi:hypothetical protein
MPKRTDECWNGFSKHEATETTGPKEPVQGFPLKFIWHTGPWKDIFNQQIELICSDIRRAKAEDKLIVYLSCPISSRGGGYHVTNVDVAKYVERELLGHWGEAFWILNPAQYQLESKAGTGLMNRHAEKLNINLDELRVLAGDQLGGDYMRMWTTVLVENGENVGQRTVDKKLRNTGQYFDAYYFIGPRDVHSFFMREGETLTAGIQAYFTRKFATDADFCEFYSLPEVDWHPLGPRKVRNEEQYRLRDIWENRRIDFLRYYSLRASVNFSLGSHDEWLIFCHLNRLRREATRAPENFMFDGDVAEQIAGFFDGGQIDPASAESLLSHGYSTP